VETALKQNTELVLSRLDEARARAGIRVAKDAFTPKVYGGSGLAYTKGYPNSIEGSAPSIFQIRTDMALFNRPKSFELAQSRETARGAGIDTANKADDIAFRTASLFLDAQQLERSLQSLLQEAQALDSVRDAVRLRLTEGRELPLAVRRAELDSARVRQRQEAVADEAQFTEETLGVVLGFPPGDRVQPLDDEGLKTEVPTSEDACVRSALEANKDVRRLQSQMTAKRLEMQAQKSQRYPQFDLVAQYALFAKYNYQDYFQKFSRNNEQLGVSIKIPILVGAGPAGLAAQAEIDLEKLRAQMNDIRSRAVLDTRKGFQDVKRAESARDFSKLDLDVSREQVRVLLDQLDEGRSTRQAVDEARLMEQEKWIAYYDAQRVLEKAKLNLLKHTGTIQAALR
jgi:outer membrane protein TolC